MKTSSILLRLTLFCGLMGCPVIAATSTIDLHPLPRTGFPVPIKVVNPRDVPAQYKDAIIKLSFTVDAAGLPRNITVQERDDPALTDSLVTALTQWRFTPASRQGVAVSMDVVLPLELSAKPRVTRPDRQIGALPVATMRREGRTVHPDLNTHEALLHVNVVTRDGNVFVMDGMTEDQVREALGQPQKIAQNVWTYPKYEASSPDADRHGCDTLLISFRNHRVSALALANDLAIKFATVQLQFESGYIERILQDMHRATNVAQN